MDPHASFGDWVKRRRRSLGLKQDELAQRAGYSLVTIRKVEQGELRPSHALAERLAVALEITAEQQPDFVRFARNEPEAADLPRPTPTAEAIPPPAPPSPPSHLPNPATPMVDREEEQATLRTWLRRPDYRLITLTGPGGTGKTRLALAVAASVRADFSGGIFFVNLIPLQEPAHILPAIAQAVGIQEQGSQPLHESLIAALSDKRVLLVLDNFEHVVEAAPSVAELLSHLPQLHILVTSRMTLHLRGEHEFSVPAMRLPARDERMALARVAHAPAIQLFVQRVQDVKPDFVLVDTNAAAVVEICHRLDGLPLAIELAAARVKILPPSTLLARLERRLPVLTGGPRDSPTRQRTLRATIEWSYLLLDLAERAFFRQMAVFVGGCSLEAVEAICGQAEAPTVDTFDLLSGLVDKSLLRIEAHGDEPRFVMLETIREYAREQLIAEGEWETLTRKHGDYFTLMAEELEQGLHGAHQARCLAQFEREHDNMRAALRRAFERQDGLIAARLGGGLWKFWQMRGYLSEGRRVLAEILSRPITQMLTGVRAKMLRGAGVLAYEQGDLNEAERCWQDAYALYQALNDQQGVADLLHELGALSWARGDRLQAQAVWEQSLAYKRRLGNQASVAGTLGNLGLVAHHLGQYDRARALFEESLALQRALNNAWACAIQLSNLAMVYRSQGDLGTARHLYEESLALAREVGDRQGVAECLDGLGDILLLEADLPAAQQALQESLAISRELEDRESIAATLLGVAAVARLQGNLADAQQRLEESLSLYRQMGDRVGLLVALNGLGAILSERHQWSAAYAYYQESLTLAHDLRTLPQVAEALTGLAVVATGQGHFEVAARLLGAANTIRDTTTAEDRSHAPGLHIDAAPCLALLEQHLGDRLTALFDIGARLDVTQLMNQITL